MAEVAAYRDLALQALRAEVQNIMTVSSRADSSNKFFNEMVGHLYILFSKVHQMESCGFSRNDIIAELTPVRNLCALSPFLQRTQEWPRGYQGDFATIEYLVEQKNLSEPGTAQYWLEEFVLGSVTTQQHRNKISGQAAEILEQAIIGMQKGKTRRILVIACGGCSDIFRIRHIIASMPISIVINDIDEGAIAYSMERLTPVLGNKIEVLHGNVLLKLKALAKMEPFDLVMTGGLYDYLSDSQAAKLTRFSVDHLLTPDGLFVFTNLAVGNPLRISIEYFSNWLMNYRTEESIDALLKKQGIAAEQIFHARDATRLAIITKILKDPTLINEQVFL